MLRARSAPRPLPAAIPGINHDPQHKRAANFNLSTVCRYCATECKDYTTRAYIAFLTPYMTKNVNLSIKRGEKLPASRGAGLTEKGREKYNRATGSNLQAPVTQANPTGKDAKRRKSFCARMGGMPGAIREPDGDLTRKGAALKRWRCNLGGK